MRICRFVREGREQSGFYFEEFVLPLDTASRLYEEHTHKAVRALANATVLDCLPPDGALYDAAAAVTGWLGANRDIAAKAGLSTRSLQLLAPIARPPKIVLLAGNYAAHIEEGGAIAVKRKETFPYCFMKPLTTLNHPGASVALPEVSPKSIDWELELGVVIGRLAKGVREADALRYVAGYTVVNDLSDRRFRPNPDRTKREKDSFFDWQHGKWHDGFCPMGPCVLSADAVKDPQSFDLELKVNGETRQDSNTSRQIFPVAAVVEFVSSFVTLEPGDVISTGTPAGVGNTTKTYLRPGDKIRASISGIGVLENQIVSGA